VDLRIARLQGDDTRFVQRKQLAGISDPVAVLINPGTKLREHPVLSVNLPVSVPTGFRLVELGKGAIAHFGWPSGKQGRHIPEKLSPIIDDTIVIPVEAEKCVVAASTGPGDSVGDTIRIDVEADRRICT